MIDLFLRKNTFNYKSRLPANTGNVYGRLYMYLDSVVEWFRKSNYFVKNEHVLVKLVNMLSIDTNWSIPNIIRYTENNITGISRGLGISTQFYIDILNKKNHIIKNTTEIVYMNNITNIVNSRDINDKNWHLLNPLIIRNHEFTDLYFNHPDRIEDGDNSIVIYDLDVVALMIMYKFYVDDRRYKNMYYSVAEFIGVYVLTNTIYSLADISILNNYLDKGNIELKPKQYVSTSMVSMNTTRLNVLVDQSILNDENQSLMEVLRNILLVNKKDAYECLFLVNFYETNKSKIYLVLTLLDFIRHILNYIDVDSRDNAGYIKKLAYEINAYKNANIYTGNSLIDTKIKNILSDLLYKIKGV